jgi:hypothetical protein
MDMTTCDINNFSDLVYWLVRFGPIVAMAICFAYWHGRNVGVEKTERQPEFDGNFFYRTKLKQQLDEKNASLQATNEFLFMEHTMGDLIPQEDLRARRQALLDKGYAAYQLGQPKPEAPPQPPKLKCYEGTDVPIPT